MRPYGVKFALITASYNAGATLTDTLESVVRQTGVAVEHWLIDGGSTDNTAVVVELSGAHLAGYVSERDHGLYDAMNKGAALSGGDVLGFINADDWYASPDSLAWVAAAFTQGADVVYGDLNFVTAKEPFQVRRVWRDSPHVPRDFFRYGWQPAHPSTFVRRALFEKVGGFDLRWRISADYVFFADLMRRPGVRLAHIPRTLTNMRLGGASTADPGAVWRANVECALALSARGQKWPWATVAAKLARKLPQLLASEPTLSQAIWRPWAGAQ
jgi:glycosyltransferase involved in cell wall biosynthesis